MQHSSSLGTRCRARLVKRNIVTENTFIFVLGAIKWMIDNELLTGTGNLSPKGIARFDQIEAEGVRATEKEALDVICCLKANKDFECDDDTAVSIAFMVSEWDKMKMLVYEDEV